MPMSDSLSNPSSVSFLRIKVILAKSLHFLAYSTLCYLTGWLRVRARFRPLLMFLIMLHAPMSEILQISVSGRSGLLTDVMIDHVGIAFGFFLSWRYWTAPDKV